MLPWKVIDILAVEVPCTSAGSALTTKSAHPDYASGIMKSRRSAGRHSKPARLSRRASSLLITVSPFC